MGSEHVQLKFRLIRHPRGIPGRVEHKVDLHLTDAGDFAYRVLDPAGHLAGHRAAWGGERHVDGDVLLVRDVDLVDQAQLVDVDRDLRVEHRLELLDELIGKCVELALAQGRRRGRLDGGGVIHDHAQAKKAWVRLRASTNASASPSVLYRAKEARAEDVTPKRFIRGSAQWVPARTATP